MFDVLIVEDDDATREALEAWVTSKGFECRAAADIASGRAAVLDRIPDLALLDLELPDGSGLDLLRELGASQDTDVVMCSGRTTVDAAIDALRLGARDFLTKPVDMRRLDAIVRSLARTAQLRHEVTDLREKLRKLGRFGDMVGVSPPMQDVYEKLGRVARTDETVFIMGPTGTGKEVTATTVHRLSRRSRKPFVAINCGAVAPNLIESELFGHERGAFTGAERRHKGVFEQADGGTLFLDEVTEMPSELQVKLLRVLETSRLTRLGASSEIEVDVRIVAATNREPREAVEEGVFREDLFYRLFVFPIELPDLRSRGEDIVILARTFLERLNEEHETVKDFTEAATERMMAYDWPGNVRELSNVVRRAFIMSDTHIDAEHLPIEGSTPTADTVTPAVEDPSGELAMRPGMSIAEAEQRLIEATLEHLDGNKKAAAEVLGISLKTLYARLKVYEAARSAS